ncbi:hypothetical protein PTSG_05918 [Salpingoeca rosetta]|uniref:Acyltransferase n=1 Tax=Salpingoeca rosetta (strain ATCC 50818 / BSB-021) TaxID=946362 RepID=F2UD59_SALR5|nr:uncharacterized protein PTSG_05918 [Salpingoeca rosetta]EGD74554.1 hypothetical protein PTSG_05918 [Salpingoeca rosetta]|eukprot:XP_004992811.1 hypothetical protein PTSG_05918 [Salpingoeca rosetta]
MMLFADGLKVWHVQAAGLAFLGGLATVIERRAAMRGCNREPMPAWFDRFLRIAFLGILAAPTCYTLDTTIMPFPICIPALLLYMIPYSDLCEQHGGRTTLRARKWALFKWLRKRFHVQLVKTADLNPDQSYIFGLHPHSVLPFGAMIAIGDETEDSQFKKLFPGIDFRTLAATFCFYVPVYRDILLWGGVVDAARYSAKRILNMGLSLALVPGGATEALHCHPEKDVVYLKNRRGFIKLALETGSHLVPVFSFNENNTYDLIGIDNPLIDKLKNKFQRVFGISLPLIKNVLPKECHITTVVGAPIAVPKIEDPSKEQVQQYLNQYIEALRKLYNDNREKYNIPKTKPPLEII